MLLSLDVLRLLNLVVARVVQRLHFHDRLLIDVHDALNAVAQIIVVNELLPLQDLVLAIVRRRAVVPEDVRRLELLAIRHVDRHDELAWSTLVVQGADSAWIG